MAIKTKRIEAGRGLKAKEKLADAFMVYSNAIFIGMLTWFVTPFLRIFDNALLGAQCCLSISDPMLLFWGFGMFVSAWFGDRFRKRSLDIYDSIEKEKSRRGDDE